jgi:hypothetical protein
MVSHDVTDDETGHTVFARLEGSLCNVVVGVIWGGDDDEVYLGVAEDVVKGAMDRDCDAETGVDLACGGCGTALEDGMELEEMRQRKDERNVERQPCKPDAHHAHLDLHIVTIVTQLRHALVHPHAPPLPRPPCPPCCRPDPSSPAPVSSP